MNKYYIKKLSIFGENKTPSYVEFDEGLNIIYGVSDTGKTCIIKCIDFVFGSTKGSPIPESHGYTTIKLLIETDKGSVTLERTIGKKKIIVTSNNPSIKSDTYTLKGIGTVLLSLIGIDNSPMIIKNSRYEQVHLTWRTFMHTFLINEEEVIQQQPILISKESTAKTASISGLLYLISAPDFSLFNATEDKKIREARKRAVENYISNEINTLFEQKKSLDKLVKDINPSTAEQEIQRLDDELSEIETCIAKEISYSKGTLSRIIAERDRLAECDLLLNRYAELRSQYKADIKRLSFIVDGETNMSLIPTPEKCPFCDGEMPVQNYATYIAASNAELVRISKLLNDLSEIEQTVINDKTSCQNNLHTLNVERNNIKNVIKSTLKPKAENLKNKLRDYRNYIRLQREIELVEKLHKEKSQDLTDMLAKAEETSAEYKPREHFPQDFERKITEMFDQTLIDCKYEEYLSGKFSLKNFDVIVNAKHKENFGKGYRAFLNVVLAIVMRDYICKYGKYPPQLLIVDSPLLSLEQGVEDSAPESMKSALIEHLMKTQSVGQTIIIENNIPTLDYSNYKVKLHNFTKGKTNGRYGLLADVIG